MWGILQIAPVGRHLPSLRIQNQVGAEPAGQLRLWYAATILKPENGFAGEHFAALQAMRRVEYDLSYGSCRIPRLWDLARQGPFWGSAHTIQELRRACEFVEKREACIVLKMKIELNLFDENAFRVRLAFPMGGDAYEPKFPGYAVALPPVRGIVRHPKHTPEDNDAGGY